MSNVNVLKEKGVTGGCVSYFSHCFVKSVPQRQLKEGRAYLSWLTFKGHHGGEGMASRRVGQPGSTEMEMLLFDLLPPITPSGVPQ